MDPQLANKIVVVIVTASLVIEVLKYIYNLPDRRLEEQEHANAIYLGNVLGVIGVGVLLFFVIVLPALRFAFR